MSRQPQNADAYKQVLLGLLPPGNALKAAPGSNLDLLLQGLAEEPAAVDASAAGIIPESLPNETQAMLPDWNLEAQLPDDCAPADQTADQQRAALTQKLSSNQTVTAAFLQEVAELLGFAVTVVKRHGRRYGDMTMYGQNVYGTTYGDNGWNFVMEIHAPLTTFQQRTYGSNYSEKYASWGNDLLECTLEKLFGAGYIRFIYT